MARSILVLAFLAFAADLKAADSNPAWQKLGAERSRTYVFVLRNGSCQSDRVQKVQPDRIGLASGKSLMRSDVIFVGESLEAHDVLYSGRSSWDDVKYAHGQSGESLEIQLKSGQSLAGPLALVSEFDISIKHSGHSITIPKRDIARVNYVRFKPVSENHKYFAQEMAYLGVLDPKWLQYRLRIDAFQPVRIYDSTIPEDNSPLTCKHPITQN